MAGNWTNEKIEDFVEHYEEEACCVSSFWCDVKYGGSLRRCGNVDYMYVHILVDHKRIP